MKFTMKSIVLVVIVALAAYRFHGCLYMFTLDFSSGMDLFLHHNKIFLLDKLAWMSGSNYPISFHRYLLTRTPEAANKTYGIKVRDIHFSGIPVRMYTPPVDKEGMSEDPLRPGIIYLRGDTWTTGSLESYEAFLHRLAFATDAVVVAVNYRMAPEFPHPASLEDCTTAIQYFADRAQKYAVDREQIVLMGDSFGGQLAVALALKLQEEKFDPPLRAQVLIHPILQVVNFQSPSYMVAESIYGSSRNVRAVEICLYLFGQQCTNNLISAISKNEHVSADQKQLWARTIFNLNNLPPEFLTGYVHPDLTKGNAAVWEKFKDVFTDPSVSPLVADSLAGLPETYLLLMKVDAARDDILWFKNRLEKEGVKVRYRFLPDGFHRIIQERYVRYHALAQETFEDLVKFIKSL